MTLPETLTSCRRLAAAVAVGVDVAAVVGVAVVAVVGVAVAVGVAATVASDAIQEIQNSADM